MDIKKQREDAILATACRLFRQRGFHQTRMAEIAREAGTSYGLVYHYFRSKADLFNAIIDRWKEGLDGLLNGELKNKAPIDQQLSAIIYYFLEQYQENPDMMHVIIKEVSRSTSNLSPAHLNAIKLLMSRTEKVIARAQAGGSLRRDIRSRYLATFFLGALEAVVSIMVLNDQPLRSKAQKDRIAKNLLDQFLTGAQPQD